MAYAAAHDDPDLVIGSATPLTARTLSHWLAQQLKIMPGLAMFLIKGVVRGLRA